MSNHGRAAMLTRRRLLAASAAGLAVVEMGPLPRAAARIAVEYVKNAEPDGSVMLFTPDFPITVYPHSFRTLNYDSLRDFTPVSPAAKSMLTYNVGPAVPESVKTLAESVEWCKANP